MALATIMALAASQVQSVTICVQFVIPARADEVHMLKDFGKDVAVLTKGEVKIEALPASAVVGVKETLDAVDRSLVECGFA